MNDNDDVFKQAAEAARKRKEASPEELEKGRNSSKEAASKRIEDAAIAAEKAARAAEAALESQKKAAIESSLAADAAAKTQAATAEKAEAKADQRTAKINKKIDDKDEEKKMGTDFEGMYASLKKATEQPGVLTTLRRTKTVSLVADPIEAAIDRNIVQPTKTAFKKNIADPIAARGNRAYQSVLSRFSGTKKDPGAAIKGSKDSSASSSTDTAPRPDDINPFKKQ